MLLRRKVAEELLLEIVTLPLLARYHHTLSHTHTHCRSLSLSHTQTAALSLTHAHTDPNPQTSHHQVVSSEKLECPPEQYLCTLAGAVEVVIKLIWDEENPPFLPTNPVRYRVTSFIKNAAP